MNVHDGSLVGTGLKVAMVVSRFNSLVSDALLAGAADCFRRHGVADDDIEVFRCPGAFELGPVLQRAAKSGRYDAVVALGAIIRGGTPHFDFVAAETVKSVAQVAMDSRCAVTLGILTTDTMEQALERAGLKAGNKGDEAAVAAIEQASILRQMDRTPSKAQAR